jgi:hypothetical protein
VIALGLILTLGVMATPAAGQPTAEDPEGCATMNATNWCEGATSVNYTFDFASPVTLLPGNDRLSVEFGTGTTFGTGYKVYVNGNVTGVVTKVTNT